MASKSVQVGAEMGEAPMRRRRRKAGQSRCNQEKQLVLSPLALLPNHPIISSFYIVSALLLSAQLAQSSPPIDYLIYTSQLADGAAISANSTLVGHQQSGGQVLPSLESIYKPKGSLSEVDKQQQQGDSGHKQSKLDQLADRVLALVQNSSHTHDNDLIDLEATRYAWHLMERQALTYMRNRVNLLRPLVKQLLIEADTSADCQSAISGWLERLAELEQWAMLMWNSWGSFPPAGVFEGSFTDLGSYRGCLGVADGELIGQAQYCTLDYQPLVPTRPRFHSIFKRVLDVDSRNGRLLAGDFEPGKLSSRNSAHEFSSFRFRPNKHSYDNKLGLNHQVQFDGWSSYPELAASDSDSNSNSNSKAKPSKRTVAEQNMTTTPSARQQNGGSNLTLTAEALIELAQKAQYFYYVKFRLGACLPSKCSQSDVRKLAKAAGQRAILQVNQVNCMRGEPVKLNGYQKVAISVLSVLALISILGTLVDLLGFKAQHDSPSFASWLLPFSIWTNSKRLFDSETAGSHADLECIHGLRFFSMLWVIYGHTILYMEYQSFTHFYDVIEKQIPNFVLLPSLNANFSVDTFFVISGILTTYVTWEFTKGDARKFNKIAFAISRYIRLTPQLAVVILCFFLLPLFGDGPMYKQVADDKAETCYKNWWINLLYLQSYINAEKLCIDPSWWLSIEMTFHLVSMVVIIVMIRNPLRGMIVNFAIAAVLTIWGAMIHYSGGFAIQYLPSIPQRYEVSLEQTKTFFHRPYPHAASYFIGIALGYVLANRTVKKLSRSQVYQGWTVCAIGLIIPLWGSYYWNLGAPYTQIQATIYYNLCQILWPISIAWIILACSLGHGGFVDSILSARCFVPLGRITYMTYLSHALIIYYHSASMNIPVEPSMLLFVYQFTANTFLSLILGVLLTVVYESPILNLQKQLFAYLTRKFDPTTSGCQLPADQTHATNGFNSQLIIDYEANATNNPKNNISRYSYKDTLNNSAH